MASSIVVSADLELVPAHAFVTLVDELKLALEERDVEFDPHMGGTIREGGVAVGSVEEWVPGERISLNCRSKSWETDAPSTLTITFAPGGTAATRVTVESQGWGRVLGDEKEELLGWFAGEAVAPLISASLPGRLGDWLTDRHARRPSGARSRGVYRDPTYHWPNFFAILDVLSLGPDDYLLDVGFGGGAFLHEALKSGCRAAGVDHSSDMVGVAAEANQEAVETRRLYLARSEADSLPYPDNTFSCAVMTGVLGFLPDPPAAFREVFRVLRPGGRFVAFTASKEIRGTPAAPEPMASRIRFYESDELEELATQAGFTRVRVDHPALLEYAKKSGVPESDLGLFKGTSASQLLVAYKP